MKLKRTLACLFILAAFPLLASQSHYNSAPFATVALAGHVIGGNYSCTCGCPACVCDPGETPADCSSGSRRSSSKTDQSLSPAGTAPTSDIDFGSGALILALAFLAWARFLRA